MDSLFRVNTATISILRLILLVIVTRPPPQQSLGSYLATKQLQGEDRTLVPHVAVHNMALDAQHTRAGNLIRCRHFGGHTGDSNTPSRLR